MYIYVCIRYNTGKSALPDMEAYFNIFITFSNVSMMYPILIYSIVGFYIHYSYGICIKAFMAVNSKEFRQITNQ